MTSDSNCCACIMCMHASSASFSDLSHPNSPHSYQRSSHSNEGLYFRIRYANNSSIRISKLSIKMHKFSPLSNKINGRRINFEITRFLTRLGLRVISAQNRDQDNSPQRQLATRQLAPKKIHPKTTRPTFRRQLAPYSEDNSPHSEDNSPQLVVTCYYLKIKLNSFRRPATLAYRWVYIQT